MRALRDPRMVERLATARSWFTDSVPFPRRDDPGGPITEPGRVVLEGDRTGTHNYEISRTGR